VRRDDQLRQQRGQRERFPANGHDVSRGATTDSDLLRQWMRENHGKRSSSDPWRKLPGAGHVAGAGPVRKCPPDQPGSRAASATWPGAPLRDPLPGGRWVTLEVGPQRVEGAE
jgi:hypothetical protein